MLIRTLLKKGTDHLVTCEDDLFVFKNEVMTVCAVFDGCSTGIKSHFASTLYSKILNKNIFHVLKWDANLVSEDFIKILLFKFIYDLKKVKEDLYLKDIELLSTFVIAVIINNKVTILVSGDGGFNIDDKEYKFDSVDNAPNYLSYHLEEDIEETCKNEIQQFVFEDFKKLSIFSDGLYSFRKVAEEGVIEKITNTFLAEENLLSSEAMLSRKYNMLIKEGYSNYDDLSIIRIIK